MKEANISRSIPAVTLLEGAGVTVHRTIGTPALRNYDPFVMLDYFCSDAPDEYIAGFPSHPHRGFSTFTYMIDGRMTHQDSLGNAGDLGPGGAQWMKAASGVIHSEMPKMAGGLMRGFQLWVNLPAANKMDAPEYRDYDAGDFPVIDRTGYSVKLLIGHFGGKSSPIIDELTKVIYLDVKINSGQRFLLDMPVENNSFIYAFEGGGKIEGEDVLSDALVIFDNERGPASFVAGEHGARCVVISGRPIGEPVVQYGPFVMNTREEIDQAMRDFHSNNFVRDRAWVKRRG